MLKIVHHNETPDHILLWQYLEAKWSNRITPDELRNHAIEKRTELLKSEKRIEGRSFLRKEIHQLKSNQHE